MEIHILQTLEYLAFDGVPTGGLEIDDFLRLGTDPAISKELIEKRFTDLISKREGEEIIQRPSFLFNLSKMPQPKCHELLGRAITRNFLVRSQLFMLALWLIRDNSGNAGAAFFLVYDDDGAESSVSERHSSYYFTAECTLVPTTFTRAELDRAIAFVRQLDTIIPKVARPLEAGRPTGLVHASRLARCLYFTQAARDADDPAVKVAFYCIVLETLFSTVKEGVTRCVSTRAASFLETDPASRAKLAKRVAKLYGYRSTVVHGGQFTPGREKALFEIAKEADTWLRRILLKILGDSKLIALFSANDFNALDAHFADGVNDGIWSALGLWWQGLWIAGPRQA